MEGMVPLNRQKFMIVSRECIWCTCWGSSRGLKCHRHHLQHI